MADWGCSCKWGVDQVEVGHSWEVERSLVGHSWEEDILQVPCSFAEDRVDQVGSLERILVVGIVGLGSAVGYFAL